MEDKILKKLEQFGGRFDQVDKSLEEISEEMKHIIMTAITRTDLDGSMRDLKTFLSTSYVRRFEVLEDDVRKIKTKLGIV